MAYGTLQTDVINTSTGIFSTNNAYTGIAKAWVNFVGASGSVNNSFNISSITRNGTGDYTANFSTAMPNANYCFSGSGGKATGTSPLYALMPYTDAVTTSSIRFHCNYVSGTVEDPTTVSFMIIGN